MIRTLNIIAVVLALTIVVGFGVVLYLRSTTLPPATEATPVPPVGIGQGPSVITTSPEAQPAPGPSHSATEVQAAYKRELPADNKRQLEVTVIVGDYALQSWVEEPMGGEALLKYDRGQRQWLLVSHGGGAWSVASLHNEGVPSKVVLALLKGLRP